MPSLSELGRYAEGSSIMMGEVVFEQAIMSMLTFLGGDKWSPPMIKECAQLAYSEYYWMSVAELTQFMQRVKLGVYVDSKNFSPSILMKVLKEYTSDMLDARYKHFSELKQKPKRAIRDLWGRIADVPICDIVILNAEKLKDGRGKKYALAVLEKKEKRYQQLRAEMLENIAQLNVAKDPYADDVRPVTDFKKTIQQAKENWNTQDAKKQLKSKK